MAESETSNNSDKKEESSSILESKLTSPGRAAESISYDELPISKEFPPHSAWGLWGSEDQLGTLNLLTPERVLNASKLIKTGEIFSLNWNLELPDPPLFAREPLTHNLVHYPSMEGHDDSIKFNTQGSTQWDGLTHWAHHKYGYYNGVKPSQITGKEGTRLGIEHMARRGIAGRLVLIDYGRYRTNLDIKENVPESKRYAANHPIRITAKDIEACAKAQGTTFQVGDILLVRTGWIEWYLKASLEEKKAIAPAWKVVEAGLDNSEDTLRFLWNNHFAAVAADTPGMEVFPSDQEMLHNTIIGLWGMPIGELFDPEKLAAHCAKDGRYECFFTSAPLNLLGGVASPPNALALK